MVNSSIEYSGLLITRTCHRYKHQLRDFFNRHRRYHDFEPSIRLCLVSMNVVAINQ